MSDRYRVAIIGAGRPLRTEGATGYGMAHAHAQGYVKTGQCDLVAVADISQENVAAFADRYSIPRTYQDYHEMLSEEKPDIVSVCTWPHLHAPMVVAAAEARVRAVHCEKPMSSTWGGARQMASACAKNGVQLTFNHQRRFLAPFQTARQLLRDGEIGPLLRVEAQCGDMIDWGTHWIDMLFFYNEETPAEWVIGQIDGRREHSVFGLKTESQGICHFKFKNDVRALVITGFEAQIGCANRIVGAHGVIEVGWAAPWVRVINEKHAGWREIELQEGIHDGVGIDRAIANLVECLGTGAEPELSGRKALQTSEVIFATYESSRRRGRVDLPLTIDDNPFVSMIEAGDIAPNQAS
ncbi:MAG TPA: Gfo/Idh/MocA family oxidoreductase [Armatimonadota bacterium]|nr:Gfo/Idh/MocA family oxidoreductase [Armatimonadota bacterium]